MYKGYLIDLDGTMYRGKERIKGAKEFIDQLQAEGLPYVFITNNSTATQLDVAYKLTKMGIQATANQVVTSAIATANYIKRQKEQAKVFMIGEEGLRQALLQNGCILTDVDVDYVVIGLDKAINYEKLTTASLLIQKGATFISTNKDAAIPSEKGLIPGNGSLTSVLAVCTRVEPLFIGKPEAPIMDEALEVIGLERDEVVMVGDNYETDILAGIQANIDTLMVLTGFSSIDDLKTVERQPTYVREHLMAWLEKGQTKV